MKRFVLIIVTLGIVVSAAACSRGVNVYGVVKNTAFHPTDKDIDVDQHQGHYVKSDTEMGPIYLYWMQSGFKLLPPYDTGILVYLNGVPVNALKKATYTVLELPAGSYRVAIGDEGGEEAARQVSLKGGDEIYYRVAVNGNWIMPNHLVLKQQRADKGKRWVSRLTYVTLKAADEGTPRQ